VKLRLTSIIAALSMLCAVLGLVVPSGAHAAAPFNCGVLDYGIYWFGLSNASQKAVPGVYNPYYNAAKPTVIYVHGWQKDGVINRKRETFNYAENDPQYGVNVNMADAWINAGWNIGIFYWNQFADEPEVKNAETKIWSGTGPQGMRWRQCDGTYSVAGSPTVSAAQLFYNAVTANMASFSGPHLRIVGHSLGSQMAHRTSIMLSDNVVAGRINARLQPTRVALMDPFWSKDGKTYLGGRWTGEVGREQINTLKTRGVIFERYKSSNINDFFIGDSNMPLTTMIGQTELIPSWIPNTDQGARHVAAYNMYFRSFAYSPPPECFDTSTGGYNCSGTGASAKTSDVRTKEMMNSSYTWYQIAGMNTEVPSDNMFQRQAR
jgi:uncharacterized protein YjdB